jgi:predicted Fe-S protein YdhL (DUF1289 family)
VNDELSVRARHALEHLGITTKEELNKRKDSDLLKLRGCGRKTMDELFEWSGYYEHQKQLQIDEKCRKASLFLVSHGYTVFSPNVHRDRESQVRLHHGAKIRNEIASWPNPGSTQQTVLCLICGETKTCREYGSQRFKRHHFQNCVLPARDQAFNSRWGAA